MKQLTNILIFTEPLSLFICAKFHNFIILLSKYCLFQKTKLLLVGITKGKILLELIHGRLSIDDLLIYFRIVCDRADKTIQPMKTSQTLNNYLIKWVRGYFNHHTMIVSVEQTVLASKSRLKV